MSALVDVHLFTDPACPFAFSAGPVRRRLQWQYGDQLRWSTTMIVLTREPGEAEKLASGADGLQRRYGMPIVRGPHERSASSEPACRAFVAARLHAPQHADALLRRLRVATMAGGLLDDPELLAGAVREAALDPDELAAWAATDEVGRALEADAAAARDPSERARALDHRLSGPREERRYSAPSVELRRADGGGEACVPGYNPAETYEIALANLEPRLRRRAAPENVAAVLGWAGERLATAEVAAVMGTDMRSAKEALKAVAVREVVGPEAYWSPAP